MVGKSDLSLIRAFLVVTVGLFSSSLLASHLFVIGLELLKLLILFCCHLILEHTSHAIDGFLLSSIVLLLFTVAVSLMFSLTHLLVSPVALVLCIEHHSVVVH